MRFFAYIVLLLINIFPFMVVSHANSVAVSSKNNLKFTEFQGVLVQTDTGKLLKTANETYLLIDNKAILDEILDNHNGVLVQSFRVCLSGVLINNTQANKNQFPQVLLVKKICGTDE